MLTIIKAFVLFIVLNITTIVFHEIGHYIGAKILWGNKVFVNEMGILNFVIKFRNSNLNSTKISIEKKKGFYVGGYCQCSFANIEKEEVTDFYKIQIKFILLLLNGIIVSIVVDFLLLYFILGYSVFKSLLIALVYPIALMIVEVIVYIDIGYNFYNTYPDIVAVFYILKKNELFLEWELYREILITEHERKYEEDKKEIKKYLIERIMCKLREKQKVENINSLIMTKIIEEILLLYGLGLLEDFVYNISLEIITNFIKLSNKMLTQKKNLKSYIQICNLIGAYLTSLTLQGKHDDNFDKFLKRYILLRKYLKEQRIETNILYDKVVYMICKDEEIKIQNNVSHKYIANKIVKMVEEKLKLQAM